MLPAVVFNIAGSSILFNIFHGVRAHLTKPLMSVENKFSYCGKVGLKFICFVAEDCKHAHAFINNCLVSSLSYNITHYILSNAD